MTTFAHSCIDYTVLDHDGEIEPFIHIYARNPSDKFRRKHIVAEGFEPFFLVRKEAVSEHLEMLPQIKRIEEDEYLKRDLFGNPLLKIVVRVPKDVSDRKTELGLLQTTFEPQNTYMGNIKFDENFLIVSGIMEGFELHPQYVDNPSVRNPHWTDLVPASVESILRRMMIDIEIGDLPRGVNLGKAHKEPVAPITLLSAHDNFTNRLFTLGWHPEIGRERKIKKQYTLPFSRRKLRWDIALFPNEMEMLEFFLRFNKWLDWDQTTGWNVEWDWRYIIARLQYLELDYSSLSPLGEVYISGMKPLIKGRIVTDHLSIYRQIEKIKREKINYKLETILQDVVKYGKIAHPGLSVGQLWHRYFNRAVLYNIRDVVGCLEIEEQTGYLQDYEERRRDCGCEWDSVRFPRTLPTFYRYRAARELGIALPTMSNKKKKGKGKGGYVAEPIIGLHELVIVLDYKTLYPTIQRMLNISPETMYPYRVRNLLDLIDLISWSGGAPYISNNRKFFRRKPDGFARQVLKWLVEQRDEQKLLKAQLGKELGWKHPKTVAADGREKAKKSATNSWTGIMDQESDIMFDPDQFEATTTTAQYCTKYVKSTCQKKEFFKIIEKKISKTLTLQVVYGDTDSIMVKLIGIDEKEVLKVGETIQNTLNVLVRNQCIKRFKASKEDASLMKLRFETVYRTFFMTVKKDVKEGKKKNYVGWKIKELTALGWVDKDEIEIKGFEWIKSNSSEIGRTRGKKILELIARRAPDSQLKREVLTLERDYKSGRFSPTQICTPTGISKGLATYGRGGKKKKGVPPQIRGAIYANQHLGIDLGAGDKPYWGWVKKSPEGYPPTDVVSFYDDYEVEGFVFDVKKMWDKEVKGKLETIFIGLGKTWKELIEGKIQKSLDEWV